MEDDIKRDREALLPCPFCGGEAVYDKHAKRTGCPSCGIWVHRVNLNENGIVADKSAEYAAWNTRAPDATEALRDAREAITDFMTGGCYLCAGDCASANPPVASCPMQRARAALAKIDATLKGDPQ